MIQLQIQYHYFVTPHTGMKQCIRIYICDIII